MRKKIILLVFIILLGLSSALADLPAQKPVSPKEEEKKGICFAPVVVGGVFLSLSLIALGLRFIRKPARPTKAQEIAQ
jgi:hypothetical protein